MKIKRQETSICRLSMITLWKWKYRRENMTRQKSKLSTGCPLFCGHPVELISLPRLSPNSSHGSRLPNPACPLSTQNEEFLVYLKEIYLKWRFLPEIRISPECWGSVSDRFKVGGRGKYFDKHTEKKRFYLKIVFEHWKSLWEILLEIKLINFEFLTAKVAVQQGLMKYVCVFVYLCLLWNSSA